MKLFLAFTQIAISSALLKSTLNRASEGIAVATKSFEACAEQERFNVIMCESHLCTGCTLAWCSTECQKFQLDFPGCRCEDWPAERKSFSSDFLGKGKFGDVGDYSKSAGSQDTCTFTAKGAKEWNELYWPKQANVTEGSTFTTSRCEFCEDYWQASEAEICEHNIADGLIDCDMKNCPSAQDTSCTFTAKGAKEWNDLYWPKQANVTEGSTFSTSRCEFCEDYWQASEAEICEHNIADGLIDCDMKNCPSA